MLRIQPVQSAAMSEPIRVPDLELAGRPHPAARGRYVLESLCVFLLGLLWMSFFYSGRKDVALADIGVPGNDSGYHVKMAAMLPEWGFTRTFPWLKFAYFRNAGDEFVSHHVGFHVLLAPFVQLSHGLTGDYMTGGRWAICTCFGLLLVAFNALLIAGGVRWRWLWITLILLLPNHFFMRHANVRAITPALLLMLLIVLALFRERWMLAGLAVLAFNLLYLGAVMFSPVIVVAYVAASMFGPAGDRRFPWKIVLGTLAGWGLGVVLYPYAGGMWEFLRLQVFGSGLNPDIRVGTEWYPYDDVWKFIINQAGPTLLIWCVALVVRLRAGPPLDARALALVLMTLAFLVLTLKAQRFIEYWPLLSLLSSAYLAAPPLAQLAQRVDGLLAADDGGRARRTGIVLVAAATAVALAALFAVWRSGRLAALLVEWQLWVMAALLVLTAAAWASRVPAATWRRRVLAVVATAAVSGAAWGGATWLAADNLKRIQSASRCSYDLKAIRAMMQYIRENSEPGEVIFTDDWDTFPIFFYHNSYNRFIVGLDPKFTQERRPDLWERYCRITQARGVPGFATVGMPTPDGRRTDERIHIRLEDIRDVFGARWVICDRDHRGLAALLNQAPELAELVYPHRSYVRANAAPYMVFRILRPGEPAATRPGYAGSGRYVPEPDANGILYLGRLEPLVIEQGWGAFAVDVSVGGGPILLGGVRYLHGLGTHAPSRLEYEVPAGFEWFEATVGVNSSQAPDGSIVAMVDVDGREAFRSERLTSEKPGATVRVAVKGARRITLLADATEDGTRSDHVDWAGARFVRPLAD